MAVLLNTSIFKIDSPRFKKNAIIHVNVECLVRCGLTGIWLLLLGLLSEVCCRVALRRVAAEHLHRETGLQSLRQRVEVGHPLLALRQARADGARTVSTGQHAGGRRMRTEWFGLERSRLRQRTRETKTGDKLELLLLRLLLQLELQDVLHRKRRRGRRYHRAWKHYYYQKRNDSR